MAKLPYEQENDPISRPSLESLVDSLLFITPHERESWNKSQKDITSAADYYSKRRPSIFEPGVLSSENKKDVRGQPESSSREKYESNRRPSIFEPGYLLKKQEDVVVASGEESPPKQLKRGSIVIPVPDFSPHEKRGDILEQVTVSTKVFIDSKNRNSRGQINLVLPDYETALHAIQKRYAYPPSPPSTKIMRQKSTE